MPENWIDNIKFLCFDVDGTLFRHVPAIWEAIQPQIYDQVMKQLTCSREAAADYVTRRYRELGSSTKLLKELGVDSEKFFTQIFENIDLTNHVYRDERLALMMKELSECYVLGIVSNNGQVAVEKKLAAVGLPLDLFGVVVTTYELGVMKPDPAPFLKALELARVAPDNTIYVGDSRENDILGAQAVGMRTAYVGGECTEADLSLPSIYDFERILLQSSSVMY